MISLGQRSPQRGYFYARQTYSVASLVCYWCLPWCFISFVTNSALSLFPMHGMSFDINSALFQRDENYTWYFTQHECPQFGLQTAMLTQFWFLSTPISLPSQHTDTPTYCHDCPYIINKMIVESCLQGQILLLVTSEQLPWMQCSAQVKLGISWMLQMCEQGLEPPRWRSLRSASLLIPLGAWHFLLF